MGRSLGCCGGEAQEGALADADERSAGEPSREADKVEAGGGEEMLQVILCQPHIAAVTQVATAHALRHRSFHSRTLGVRPTECLRFLPLPRGHEGSVLLLRPDRDRPPTIPFPS